MKNIAIFGSTGSIGKQAIDVILEHPELYKVNLISANGNVNELINQVSLLNPKYVCIGNKVSQEILLQEVSNQVQVICLEDFSVDILKECDIDLSIVAIPGFAGLKPTIEAIKLGKTVALANKESLVVAGNIIMDLVNKYETTLIPVDSEHSAIFQCLVGEDYNDIDKVILSCSGGPFFGKNLTEIDSIGSQAATKHPIWSMGPGITIDSATLMNKAFEIVEAKWLFNLCPDQIECIIHPECIIHSSVIFKDGSVKAQLGFPDMREPIQYALTYPNRIKTTRKKFSFEDINKLNFHKPDKITFKSLNLAYISLQKGGNIACALNSANEISRDLFARNKLSLSQFYEVILETIKNITFISSPTYEDYIGTDKEARLLCYDIYKTCYV